MLTNYETTLLLQALNAKTTKEKIQCLQDLLETEIRLFIAWYDRRPDLTGYAEHRDWSKLTINAMLKLHRDSLSVKEREALCVVLNAWIEELIQGE